MAGNVVFNGGSMPALGMGTWFLGEGRRPVEEEADAICAGIDAGLRLIDTAEMYGDGGAERMIGRVLQRRSRDGLCIVSKVYPHNAGRSQIFRACERSLSRMGTDHIDIYLLHWRGSVPLQETVDCMEDLVRQGKILRWGVSNFDLEDMQELFSCADGANCAVNQDLYHLGSRGIDYVLRPWQDRHEVATMAYCPLAQAGHLRAGLLKSAAVREVAQEEGLTPMQVLLGFTLAQDRMVSIPRTGTVEHMLLNAAMAEHPLSEESLKKLDAAFPAPKRRVGLDMQ